RVELPAAPPDPTALPWLQEPPWPRRGRVMDIAFHPREEWLAVVKQGEPVELLQLPQGTLLRHLGDTAADDAIAFSGCGRWAIYSTRPPLPVREPGVAAEDYSRNPCLYDLEASTA